MKEECIDLCEKQERLIEVPSQENIHAEQEAAERWQRILAIKEKVLKQRSKLHCLQVEDE